MEWIVFKSNDSVDAYNQLSKKNKDKLNEWLYERQTFSQGKKRCDNRKRTIIKILTFLNKDWDKINYQDYVKVSVSISKCDKIKTYTKNDERNFIKRFLKDSFDDWEKKFKKLELLRSEQKSEKNKLKARDLLTKSEIEKMMKVTSDMKKSALIAVLYHSGARPDEIVSLRYDDVDFNKKQIYFYSAKTKGKRAIYMDDTISYLSRLKKETDSNDDDLVFPSVRGGIMTNTGLNYILKDLARKAGIKKKIWARLFRHTRLSFLITKLTPKVYEEVAGHSLKMGLKTYAHLSQDKIIKEMKESVFEVEDLSPEETEKFKELEVELNKMKEKFKKMEEDKKEIIKVLNLPQLEEGSSVEVPKRILKKII